MEIAVHPIGNTVEVQVRGRLDNTWSDFLASNLDQIVADGAHQLRIDLSEVNFVSSAGIGVLVRYYNQLRGIAGSFEVVRPSRQVLSVLKLTALENVLCHGPEATTAVAPESLVPTVVRTDAATYDIYDLPAPAPLDCRILGNPTKVFHSALTAESCHRLGAHRFSLGVGALGADFDDCRERFGEFIGVESAAAYQPTEVGSPPDYLVGVDGSLADAQLLYGLAFDGGFQKLIRFESGKQPGPIKLEELVRRSLEFQRAAVLGMAMIAEVSGLVGTALRRSPALEINASNSARSMITDWLSFSPERSMKRTVAVVVGAVATDPPAELVPFFRPLGGAGDLQGHFHAAVFTYQPLQRGVVQVHEAVKHVFESQTLLAVLHLLNDTRAAYGIGDSEFVRGACWIAEVSHTRRSTA